MRARRVWVVKIVIIFFERSLATSACDKETGIILDEGNMGQSEDFNWLGILKVYLDDGDGVQVAVTGIVLVRPKYAIASADDVVRIPRSVFQTETQAMFITAGDTVVHFTPAQYLAHPEYELATYNTIALVELNIGNDNPLIPICFPGVSYDSSYLYVVGYTDENKIVEKVIYRIEYIEKRNCEEFYERAGLRDVSREPTSYVCGAWRNTSEDCVWDTGMALVSNNTGWFTLVGLSIHGPGCAAPARFINIPNYMAWIDDVTRERNEEDEEDNSEYDPRRSNDWDMDNIPIHRTFTARKSFPKSWPKGVVTDHEYEPWPFNTKLPHFNIEPHWEEKGVIAIYPFNLTQEMYIHSCKKTRVLMYREYFELSPLRTSGSVTYKLSLYDLVVIACSCVTIEIECQNRSEAILSFREEFVFTPEGRSSMTSPPEVFKTYPITERGVKIEGGLNPEKNRYIKPSMLQLHEPATGSVLNYDLYIRFTFNKTAILKVKMFGEPRQFTNPNMPLYRLPARRKFEHVKKNKTHKPKMRYWGLSQNVIDKAIKEASLEAENAAVVQETVSEGNQITPADILVLLFISITPLLISSCGQYVITKHEILSCIPKTR